MQAFAAMQQSCTCDKGNCFFTNQQGGEGKVGGGRGEGGGEPAGGGGGQNQNYNAVFCSNAAELYSWTKATVSLQ